MQLVKGRFSYRLKHEFGFQSEIWQRGFSEVQITDEQGIVKSREYIRQNPVKAGLAQNVDEYPFCFGFLALQKAASATKNVVLQGLKPN
jgi:putative transposase